MKKLFKYIFLAAGIVLLIVVVFFIAIKKQDNKVLEMENFYTVKQDDSKPYLVPSMFIEGERFYVKLPIENGDTIIAFGDTGGGNSMMLPSTVAKKHFQSKLNMGLLKGIMPVHYILFKNLVTDTSFPQPNPLRSFIIRHPFSRVTEPSLVIPPMDDEMKLITQSMPNMEIFLGQNFFMGKAWTIDYIHQNIWVNTPLTENDKSNPNVQKIGFKKNNNHENIFGHASMFIEVNGEIIEVLFDTGATLTLSDYGKKELNTSAKTIGGSFIATSIFDKWRKEHPEWKYYPKADMNNDVIEVPIVKIGGNEVGPVLFAKRPDENWSNGMINTMDKVVKGAIGGSGLKYLKVTIDYNLELIKFEK
jgi:hypothetical protein